MFMAESGLHDHVATGCGGSLMRCTFFGALPPGERTALMRLLQRLLPATSPTVTEASHARLSTRPVHHQVRRHQPPARRGVDYLADARNWPHWSVVKVLAIEATSDPAWWNMTTPRGRGELHIRGDAATGLLDHDFRDPQAAWTVPARVVPNGRGAEFLISRRSG
jgi:hypothetical protein